MKKLATILVLVAMAVLYFVLSGIGILPGMALVGAGLLFARFMDSRNAETEKADASVKASRNSKAQRADKRATLSMAA